MLTLVCPQRKEIPIPALWVQDKVMNSSSSSNLPWTQSLLALGNVCTVSRSLRDRESQIQPCWDWKLTSRPTGTSSYRHSSITADYSVGSHQCRRIRVVGRQQGPCWPHNGDSWRFCMLFPLVKGREVNQMALSPGKEEVSWIFFSQ